MNRLLSGIAQAVAIGAFTMTSAWANPVLEFSNSSTLDTFSPDASVGWSFTTNQAITVTALDVFDPSGTGNVRLYNAAGTTLASVTLTAADAQEGTPTLFFTRAITPITLLAYTTYYIAQDEVESTTSLFHNINVGDLLVNPLITYGAEVAALGLGQNPTADVAAGSFNSAFFGPNFDAQPAQVPEPASLALVGMGIAGLAILRRRKAA
jgi:hypothetical protein